MKRRAPDIVVLPETGGMTMRNAVLPAALVLALAAVPALAQTANQAPANQQPQPGLSSDVLKPQQNSADEAAVRGRMEDGVKPPDAGEQGAANKKVEDAAVAAKQKSDSNAGSGTAPAAKEK
jgi:hypothetical protein